MEEENSEQLTEEVCIDENSPEYLKRTGDYGHSQSKKTKAKISKESKGPKNSQWKDGRHHTYQRRIMGLKKGDGKVVHHKDENRHHNTKSNFKVMTKAKHNRHHHKK